ncbi:ABC transporter permease [Roseivirga sp. E12]|uniref:ABC transporter permease n=1 Tax=Roseivirga sp. E12 TaxID=2819237 RepID=UPI001ABC7485|nr:ABC transporter permease [Roseivirga sp. E12]MBO3699805.1 ABC transporter permease [Roseivirga sp. E12]
MLKNYFKIALRSLIRHKGYSFINIFGLTVGIAAATLILLYAQSELSYDKMHSQAEQIQLLYKERVTPTGTQDTYDTWAPTLEALQADYSEVLGGTRLTSNPLWLSVGDKRFLEDVTLTDPSFFTLFDYSLKEGSRESVLNNINAIVISQEVADRLFPGEDPMGKTINAESLDNQYIVTGILGEIPYNTRLQPEVVIPIQSHPQYEGIAGNWNSSFMETYLLLQPGTDIEALESRFEDFITKIWNEETASNTNFRLLNLLDVYDRFNENRQYAYILLTVAIVILTIASINFMNLATARSMERAKEAGMRKVLGALRGQMIAQYLIESLTITFFSLTFGIILASLLLPSFNEFYNVELTLNLIENPLQLGLLIGIGLFIGFSSGLYPALYLTSLKSVDSLKGKVLKARPLGKLVRNGLVVLQFVFSILLIVGTLVIRKQVNFMKNKDMSFNKANLMVLPISLSDFPNEEEGADQLTNFRNTLRNHSAITSLNATSSLPGNFPGRFTFVVPDGFTPDQRLRMRFTYVDHNFFSNFQINLKQGRNFLPDSEQDRTGSAIVNQAAMDAFGWTDIDEKYLNFGSRKMKVIAVSENYNYQSLANEVAPVIHYYRRPTNGIHGFTVARVQEGRSQDAIELARTTWQSALPNVPFDYYFLDDQFEQLYEQEDRLTGAIGAFSVVAIIIASLGLLGLSSLMTTQRTKEIGIRKVLGSSVFGIVRLLSTSFTRMVLLAFIVSVPVAVYGLNLWLSDFAYQTDIGVLVFVVALLGTFAVSMITVGIQTAKAAMANPIQSMRYE